MVNKLRMVLIAASAVLSCGFAAAAGQEATFDPGITLTDSIAEGCLYATVHARAVPALKRHCTWGIVWGYTDSLNYYMAVMSLPDAADVQDVYINSLRLDVVSVDNGTPRTLASATVSKGVAFDRRPNSMKLVYDTFSARLYIGEHEQQKVAAVPFASGATGIVTDMPLKCVRMETVADYAADLGVCPTPVEDIMSAEYSMLSAEGIYEYLDRDIDTRYASLGGNYRVALLSDSHGGYSMVYLSGASVNPDFWTPGKVKATLNGSGFAGNYDMRWLDSSGRIIDEDVNAQLSDDGMVLTLRFPMLASQIRLRRVR